MKLTFIKCGAGRRRAITLVELWAQEDGSVIDKCRLMLETGEGILQEPETDLDTKIFCVGMMKIFEQYVPSTFTQEKEEISND